MHVLPLTLTVTAARSGPRGVAFDCRIEDAKGISVQSDSVSMAPGTTAAEATAILQSHVETKARALLKRGEVELAPPEATPEEQVGAIEAMVGKVFTGSAVPQ